MLGFKGISNSEFVNVLLYKEQVLYSLVVMCLKNTKKQPQCTGLCKGVSRRLVRVYYCVIYYCVSYSCENWKGKKNI